VATGRYWVVKSEPSAYAWSQLVAERRTEWTGIRNFEARNNLRAMSVGNLCLYYHSGEEKAVVGVARVTRAAAPDPTARGEDWSSVELEAVGPLAAPVTLAQMKKDTTLKALPLVTRPRLSVGAVTPAQFARIEALGTPRRKG
jgi:predicted RNA-binding protein with PUA-like domain